MNLIDKIITAIKCQHRKTHYEWHGYESVTGRIERIYQVCSDCGEILCDGKDLQDCQENQRLTKHERMIKKYL